MELDIRNAISWVHPSCVGKSSLAHILLCALTRIFPQPSSSEKKNHELQSLDNTLQNIHTENSWYKIKVFPSAQQFQLMNISR